MSQIRLIAPASLLRSGDDPRGTVFDPFWLAVAHEQFGQSSKFRRDSAQCEDASGRSDRSFGRDICFGSWPCENVGARRERPEAVAGAAVMHVRFAPIATESMRGSELS